MQLKGNVFSYLYRFKWLIKIWLWIMLVNERLAIPVKFTELEYKDTKKI